MEQIKREALRKAAEAATPGPWATEKDRFSDEEGWVHTVFDPGINMLIKVPFGDGEEPQVIADTTYIASANPQAVLDLLSSLTTETARADALQGQVERLTALLTRTKSAVSTCCDKDVSGMYCVKYEELYDELKAELEVKG